MADIVRDYCRSSTLYIVRYIGDSRRSYIERCLWVVVLSVTSGLLLYHLLSDWKELRQGPLRVAVEDSRLSVANIDFPAVTVCPVNVIDPDRLNLLMTRVLGSGFEEDIGTRFSTTLKALTMVTNPRWDGGYTYFQSQNVTPFPIHNDDIIPFLKAVTHSIDDIIKYCYWRGSYFNCSDIFRLQSTELGLCHSFNSYTSLQSSTDSKMNPPFHNEKGELVGFRSIFEGRSSGIDLILHPKQSVGSGNIIVRAVVSSPRVYPPVSMLRPLQHQPEGMYRMEVQVEVTKAHSSLRAMDGNWLPCSLSGSDTMENCLLNCRSRHIWQHCGCVLYTHALLLNTDEVTICGIKHFNCLSRLTTSLNYIELRCNSAKSASLVCDCKPVCSETMYSTNTQLMPRETTVFTSPYSVHFDVFYFSKWAMGYVVRGKITQSDVIVGLGGTSGLYLGASFISFIEVLVMVVKVFFSKT